MGKGDALMILVGLAGIGYSAQTYLTSTPGRENQAGVEERVEQSRECWCPSDVRQPQNQEMGGNPVPGMLGGILLWGAAYGIYLSWKRRHEPIVANWDGDLREDTWPFPCSALGRFVDDYERRHRK